MLPASEVVGEGSQGAEGAVWGVGGEAVGLGGGRGFAVEGLAEDLAGAAGVLEAGAEGGED